MPLQRRLPKLPGFMPRNRVAYQTVNVGRLEERFDDGAEVTVEPLRSRGIVRDNAQPVKMLGDGPADQEAHGERARVLCFRLREDHGGRRERYGSRQLTMLRAFTNAFKIPDLRGKILFTLAIIAVYRFGSFMPIPGVDYSQLRQLVPETGGFQALLNLFSGGALTQLAVFALGIMPYITASIIMQLLAVVIPKLEEWRQEGETGQKRITQ